MTSPGLLPIAQSGRIRRQFGQACPFFLLEGRAAGQNDFCIDGLPENLFGKEKAERAQPACDQVDAVVFQHDRHLLLRIGNFLPAQSLTRPLTVSNQRIKRARLLSRKICYELFRCNAFRNEDDLTGDLRVLERSSPEQSGKARQQGFFVAIFDHNLDQDFAPGLATENGLYPLKAGQRMVAIAFGDIGV